ncbi:MAG TPA: class I SAM-dependent methyltransferase, partial [Actinomycetota bacterium]|nr:class I SAM-dependent methyltransferase [Actinomycetota bacterium]
HVVAYDFVARYVRGARVLDAGCGEGYGTDRLTAVAAQVTGVDLEEPVIRRAASRYPRARFDAANLVSLPYDDGAFDAVVSLQVIEHLHSPQEFLAECARVLEADGVIIISTPNRLTFSPDGMRNPFHTFEFAPTELRAAIAQRFSSIELAGTFHGPRVRLLEMIARSPFPERLIAQPVPEWPGWLRAAVERVRAGDFVIRWESGSQRLERSLDLIAIARR